MSTNYKSNGTIVQNDSSTYITTTLPTESGVLDALGVAPFFRYTFIMVFTNEVKLKINWITKTLYSSLTPQEMLTEINKYCTTAYSWEQQGGGEKDTGGELYPTSLKDCANIIYQLKLQSSYYGSTMTSNNGNGSVWTDTYDRINISDVKGSISSSSWSIELSGENVGYQYYEITEEKCKLYTKISTQKVLKTFLSYERIGTDVN